MYVCCQVLNIKIYREFVEVLNLLVFGVESLFVSCSLLHFGTEFGRHRIQSRDGCTRTSKPSLHIDDISVIYKKVT